MKSFKQFLEAKQDFDLEKFKSDCSFFLNMTAGKKVPMYHGTKNPPADWEIRKWIEREKPRDTALKAHDAFNEFFKEKFGAPIRNWMFATGEYSTASVYAANRIPCVIVPIGKFEWVCGDEDDLRDLTGWFNRVEAEIKESDPTGKMPDSTVEQLTIRFMIQRMKHMNWEHNTNLVKCLKADREIMFKCDKFYMFNFSGDVYNDMIMDIVG